MIMVEEIEIDNKTYKLSAKNYVNKKSKKEKILIADTYSEDMKHFLGWKIFNNGNFKKTAHYTIDSDGKIFEHFSPKKYSNFLKNGGEKYIIILIENIGWLKKEKENYKSWNDTIYNGEVVSQYWRDKKYWSKYKECQINSFIGLINHLTNTMGIEKNIKSNSFLDNNIENFKGIIYRSNFSKTFKDINPSWDFEKIKEKVK